MTDATKRSIFRWIHIGFGIPIIGYIYSPFKELPNYAPVQSGSTTYIKNALDTLLTATATT
jgi:hypothetical protein